jgi:hypothetical protein
MNSGVGGGIFIKAQGGRGQGGHAAPAPEAACRGQADALRLLLHAKADATRCLRGLPSSSAPPPVGTWRWCRTCWTEQRCSSRARRGHDGAPQQRVGGGGESTRLHSVWKVTAQHAPREGWREAGGARPHGGRWRRYALASPRSAGTAWPGGASLEWLPCCAAASLCCVRSGRCSLVAPRCHFRQRNDSLIGWGGCWREAGELRASCGTTGCVRQIDGRTPRECALQIHCGCDAPRSSKCEFSPSLRTHHLRADLLFDCDAVCTPA